MLELTIDKVEVGRLVRPASLKVGNNTIDILRGGRQEVDGIDALRASRRLQWLDGYTMLANSDELRLNCCESSLTCHVLLQDLAGSIHYVQQGLGVIVRD